MLPFLTRITALGFSPRRGGLEPAGYTGGEVQLGNDGADQGWEEHCLCFSGCRRAAQRNKGTKEQSPPEAAAQRIKGSTAAEGGGSKGTKGTTAAEGAAKEVKGHHRRTTPKDQEHTVMHHVLTKSVTFLEKSEFFFGKIFYSFSKIIFEKE